MVDSGTHTHHIHQRINGAHLVEMHGLSRDPVHCRFRLRKSAEHREHPLAQSRRQGRIADGLTNLCPVTVLRHRFHRRDADPFAAETTALGLVHIEAVTTA